MYLGTLLSMVSSWLGLMYMYMHVVNMTIENLAQNNSYDLIKHDLDDDCGLQRIKNTTHCVTTKIYAETCINMYTSKLIKSNIYGGKQG